MNGDSVNREGGALAVMKQSLPATSSFAFSEDEMKEFDYRLRSLMSIDRDGYLMGRFGLRAIGYGSGYAAFLLLAGGAIPGALLFGAPALVCAYVGTGMANNMRNDFHGELDFSRSKIQEAFQEKQKKFTVAQKKRLLAAAESHIARGNVLSVEDLSWLVNLDPKSLANAGEKLAITVLQARKALAFMRSGNLVADPVATFASLEIKPDLAPNRTYLSEQLAKADSALREDDIFCGQQVEFAEEPLKKPVGRLRAFVEFCIPFSDLALGRAFRKASLPALKPIEIRNLQPAADFAEALEDYEAENAPLDLPAMRGWNGAPARIGPPPARGLI